MVKPECSERGMMKREKLWTGVMGDGCEVGVVNEETTVPVHPDSSQCLSVFGVQTRSLSSEGL